MGGRGGDGGNAGLNWGTGNHTIGSLNVLAGANGAAGFGWTDTGTGYSYYSSGGVGGSAKFFLNGNLTTTGTVNVQARGNYATYTSNNLTAGGATFEDVVMLRVYLTTRDDFGAMNEVYGEFVAENCPSGQLPGRTTVFVDLPHEVIEERLAKWKLPMEKLGRTRGILGIYAKTALQAHLGAMIDDAVESEEQVLR